MTKITAIHHGFSALKRVPALAGSALLAAAPIAATAQSLPKSGGYTLIEAGSPLATEVHLFHNWILMPVMVAISLFVLALLLIVIVRFNEKSNPNASRFSHNTFLEVVWTFIPIVILLFIALFSFDLLFKEGVIPDGKQETIQVVGSQSEFTFANDFNPRRKVTKKKHLDVFLSQAGNSRKLRYKKDYKVTGFGDETLTIKLNQPANSGEQVIIHAGQSRVGAASIMDMMLNDTAGEIAMAPSVTLKATGLQWAWQYNYPEFGDFEFLAKLLPEDETTKELYLFETDNHVVLPVGETIRLITTASDVIHAWAMPSFAVKVDAVPGRNNETWFKANKTGMYYGQCSEICGKDHSFMPIAVKVVTRPEFEAWIDQQRALAGLDPMFNLDLFKVAAAPAASK